MGALISIPANYDILGWVNVALLSTFILFITIFLELLDKQIGYGKFSRAGLASIECENTFLKFFFNTRVSAKMMWLIAYSSPIIAYITPALILSYQSNWSNVPSFYFYVLLITFTLHYIKRDIETVFVHIFSDPNVQLATSINIVFFYSYVGFALGYQNNVKQQGLSDAYLDNIVIISVGLVLFIIGEMGNAYCHWIVPFLRKMKMAESEQEYERAPYLMLHELPKIFQILIVPNYVFEVIAWLGFCIIARTLIALIMLFGMAWYLMERLWKTKKWYDTQSQAQEAKDNSASDETQALL